MPVYKTKNEDFFKVWSPSMAYVLGFFTADGSMYKTKRGTHFIDFQITDKELLEGIRDALSSNHNFSPMFLNYISPILCEDISMETDVCILVDTGAEIEMLGNGNLVSALHRGAGSFFLVSGRR